MNNAEVLIKFKGDTSDIDKTTKNISSSFKGMSSAMTVANLAASAISKGIQLITQNLDGAIGRIDAMNNFPKVMKNLGISATESDKAINTLSESLVGLPTTLDSAALSVQRITSKNGDVQKSTDLFLAMNNAILAGGAPAATQSAAIEQLSQAYAKGKPDMMEWRTLMTAMPAQLKQVATAMGYVNADSLGEDLRNGTVSMDDFMDTIVKLNKKGLPGLENFDTQARNATGGLATAMQNAKTAVTRGVASIVTSFDSALQSNGLGSLATVISTIGRAFEKLLKGEALDLSKVTKFAQGFINTVVSIAKNVAILIPEIIKALGKMLPSLISSLAKGMVEIANTMAKMMPTLIPTIVKAVMQIIPALIDALPLIMDAGMQMQFALIDGIMAALPQLIQSMPVIIERFLSALIPQLPKIMAYAPKIILALAKGLISAIPTLVSQIPQIVRAIINGLSSGIGGFVNVGKNMARGLWNGIKGLKDWVISKVKGMGNEIVKSLKKTLGIHSPSTEFALVGKFSVLGYTEQLEKMQKDVQNQVAETFGLNPQLTGSMQNSFSPNVNVYNNVNVEQDPLGQMVSSIKTFSGGAKNDYNYGSGI